MGTCIESVATSCDRGKVIGRGALHLIDDAATRCLERAGCKPSELDLLINASLYKDANTAEPALATIIQRDIHANRDVTLFAKHATFSFDILNGGCGVVTAARLLETFEGSGTAQRGLIVAGDVDPSPRTSLHFPFAPAAGAMLVSHVERDAGFRSFEIRTFPEYAHLFGVTLHWAPSMGALHRGRNVIDVHEDPSFGDRCVELATATTLQFLHRLDLSVDDIDLLITSQYPRVLVTALPERLGIAHERVPAVPPEFSFAHTAGPLAALEVAFESRQLQNAHRSLIVTVGAGITVGIALYEA